MSDGNKDHIKSESKETINQDENKTEKVELEQETIEPDGSVLPEVELEYTNSKTEKYFISKENLPTFKKVLVTDDGKDLTNKALNYAISLSNSTNSELVILHILTNIEKFDQLSVVGDNTSQQGGQNFQRIVEGDIIDNIENKIKQYRELGITNKISYKILTGDVIDEIVNEIDSGYDLVIMSTKHINSWLRSLFSETLKVISSIKTPVLIIQ